MAILKVTKNQGFTLSLAKKMRKTTSAGGGGGGGGGACQVDSSSLFRVKEILKKTVKIKIKVKQVNLVTPASQF